MYVIEEHKVFPLVELTEDEAFGAILDFKKEACVIIDGKPLHAHQDIHNFLHASVVTNFMGVTTVREYQRTELGTYIVKATSLKAIEEEADNNITTIYKAVLLVVAAIYVVFAFALLATQDLSDIVVFFIVIILSIVGYFVRYLETS